MDDRLFFLINRVWTNAFADQVLATLTSAAVWLPFLTGGLGVGLWFGTFRVRSFLLVAAVALLAVAGPFNSAAKRWAHRPRPSETEPGVRQVALQRVRPAFLGILLPVRIRYSGNAHEAFDVEDALFEPAQKRVERASQARPRPPSPFPGSAGADCEP